MKLGPILLVAGLVGGTIICFRRGHLGIFRHHKAVMEQLPDPWTDQLNPPWGVM